MMHEDWLDLKRILERIAEAVERLCDEVECLPRLDVDAQKFIRELAARGGK